jgi:hypothetical protein
VTKRDEANELSMEYPENTKSDIEDGKTLSIVAKVTNFKRFDDGNEMYYLTDIEGSNTKLKIWDEEVDLYEIEVGRWYLFENAEGDTYGDPMLGSNRGDMQTVVLEEPPESVEESLNEASEDVIEGGVLAVDIETISLVPESEIDLSNSNHVSLLCIGVGYTPELGMPGRSAVLFREGSQRQDEENLLERFCEYVEDRNPDQLVLFRGDFDRTHLRGRATLVAEDDDLNSRVNATFENHRVVNLTPPGSLEDNADVIPTYWDIYNHSLDPAEWRQDHPRYTGELDDPEVTNKDIPYFGARYLELRDEERTNREFRALHELIRHYTESDIIPLFDLASQKI